MAIPIKDVDLVPYSANVNTQLVAHAAVYGVSNSTVTQFTSLQSAYANSVTTLQAATETGTRSKMLAAAKDDAKKNLLALARQIYTSIQANPTISNENKIQIGVHIRKTPVATPMPEFAPEIKFDSVSANIINLTLQDSQEPTKKSKPKDVASAHVYSYVGTNPPNDISAWKFEGESSRPQVRIVLPLSTPPFARVWVTAQWVNRRGEAGPATTPKDVNIGSWVVQAA